MPIVDLERAIKLLRDDLPLAFPTETFYGLGCNALSQRAVSKLNEVKPRTTGAYPVIIGSIEQLNSIVKTEELSPLTEALIRKYWPGPLTLLLPPRDNLPPQVIGPTGKIAVRLTSHPLAAELSKRAQLPLIATSANPPGSPPPQTAPEVVQYFPELPVLDGGPTPGEKPSTIVEPDTSPPKFVRPGALSPQKLLPDLLPSQLYSRDGMFREKVKIYQQKKGYRFSLDSVLLSHFAAQFRPTSLLDIGTGCGVIPLLVAHLWMEKYQLSPEQLPLLTGVEFQTQLAELAKLNALANELHSKIEIFQADIRDWRPDPSKSWSLITINPPYRKPGSGPKSPDSQRAVARTQLRGDLTQLLAAAKALLGKRGRILLVYPASKLPEIIDSSKKNSLWLKKIQLVYPHLKRGANLILCELKNQNYREIEIAPPLVIYRDESPDSPYTPEVEAMLNGEIVPF